MLALGLAACAKPAHGARTTNDASVPPAEEPVAEAPAETPEAAQQREPSSAELATPAPKSPEIAPQETTVTAQPLSDPAIGTIVVLVHQSEIEQGELAKKRAQDPRVAKFAGTMVSDHKKGLEKHTALSRQIGLHAEESSLSNQLKSDAALATADLKKAEKDFDRAYVDGQAAAHAKVLNTIDTELLPNATNPELRSELEKLRTVVEKHLMHARELQQKLSAAGTR